MKTNKDRNGVEYPTEWLTEYTADELRACGIAVGDPVTKARSETPEQIAAAECLTLAEATSDKRYCRAQRAQRESGSLPRDKCPCGCED